MATHCVAIFFDKIKITGKLLYAAYPYILGDAKNNIFRS